MEEKNRNTVLQIAYQSTKTPQARRTAKLRLTNSNLMLKTGDRYPRKLQSEKPESASTSQGTLVESEIAQSLTLGPLSIPYDALHYIFEDFINKVKTAMFRFGNRELPGIMQSENWYETMERFLCSNGLQDGHNIQT
jgi:hypothetical protein